jgi:hypothetical protein
MMAKGVTSAYGYFSLPKILAFFYRIGDYIWSLIAHFFLLIFQKILYFLSQFSVLLLILSLQTKIVFLNIKVVVTNSTF